MNKKSHSNVIGNQWHLLLNEGVQHGKKGLLVKLFQLILNARVNSLNQ